MSVDITRLTEHLTPAQQQEVRRAYQRRAEHETVAFLWCFFLGVVGAHRFYLGQWRRGIGHLALFLVAVGAVISGVVINWSPVVTAAIAAPLLLIALVWVIVDLFRIDAEVTRRNLILAERLTAEALLDDPARGRMALETLAAVEQREAAVPAPIVAVVTVSPDDSRTPAEAVVATPETLGVGAGIAVPFAEEVAAAGAAHGGDSDWETAPNVEVHTATGIAGIAEGEGYHAILPDAPAAEPTPEAQTNGPGDEVTPETEATVVETAPSWSAETAAADAAIGAATGAALGSLYLAHEDAAAAPSPGWPLAPSAEPPALAHDTPAASSADTAYASALGAAPTQEWSATQGAATAGSEAAAFGTVAVAASAAAASVFGRERYGDRTSFGPVPSAQPGRDITDLGGDGASFAPISDVEPDTALRAGFGASLPASGSEPGSQDATLLLVPDSDTAADTGAWHAAPEWPVASAAEPDAADDAAPADAATGETLAELAAPAVGGAAAFVAAEMGAPETGSGDTTVSETSPAASTADPATSQPASAGHASPQGQPQPDAETPRHLLKHIRVVRQVKVGDDVVEESVAEAFISPDEDPEPVRQRLREQLRREAEDKHQRDGVE